MRRNAFKVKRDHLSFEGKTQNERAKTQEKKNAREDKRAQTPDRIGLRRMLGFFAQGVLLEKKFVRGRATSGF